MSEKIDLVKVMLDWGWTGVGALCAAVYALVIDRVTKVEKQVAEKADAKAVANIALKQDVMYTEMRNLFDSQNAMIGNKVQELIREIHTPRST